MLVYGKVKMSAAQNKFLNLRKHTAKLTFKIKTIFSSPYGATIFPFFLLVTAFLFPPSIYSYYVKEPDYMFLNIKMLIFGVLCLFFYYIGIFIGSFKPLFNFNLITKKIKINSFLYIVLILILSLILQFVFLIVIYIYFSKVSGISLFTVIFLGYGDIIKTYSKVLKIPYGLGAIQTILAPIEFWLLYKIYYAKNNIPNKKYKLLKSFVTFSAILYIIENILLINRPLLMIFIIGWIMIYSYFNKVKIFSILFKLFLLSLILFAITSIIRWASTGEDIVYMIIGKLLGYTIADFNRMVLMIENKLSYVSAGVPGIFFLLPITKIPGTEITFFKIPDYSYFSLSAVNNVGLNGSYNMATLFGGIYQVIGIATPVYFFFLGIVGSRLFISFKRGKNFGIILYPLFYASVTLWMIDVNFFILDFLYYFYIFIILTVYSAFFR